MRKAAPHKFRWKEFVVFIEDRNFIGIKELHRVERLRRLLRKYTKELCGRHLHRKLHEIGAIGQRHIVLLRPVVPRSMPPEVIEEMKSRFVRDFHVPLNETLHAVVYADDAGVQQAMKIIYDGKGKLEERVREAAEATDADYIAGFVVTNYGESSYRNWKGDLILHSYVSLQLIGYDRERDLVIDLPASRGYNGEYTRSGTARILALFELDRLMDEANFSSTLFPVKDWIDKPREKSTDAK